MLNRHVKAAVAGALAAGVVSAAFAQSAPTPAPTPKFSAEKCYGVARAGKNDCQTNTSACAGTSKTDNQGDAWIYVPRGTCAKIVGGSTTKKA